jgi:uncharacterized protein (TIGR02145 family)
MKNKSLFALIALMNISLCLTAQDFDTLTDLRDGKVYKTVKIGSQTWMAENLAFKTNQGCWEYGNDENNGKTYGYLYNFTSAKKVCPTGWSLPNYEEWDDLINFLGGEKNAGEKLKSTTGWENGKSVVSNSSGFSALPGGVLGSKDQMFYGIGEDAGWWSSTLVPGTSSMYAWDIRMFSSENFVGRLKSHRTHGSYIRCIKR